jgi:hypothetical protein
MPSRRSGNDLVLFSTQDPRALVNWLCDTYGLTTILQSVAEYRPTGAAEATTTKRAYKKRGRKPGPKKGSKKGSKKGAGKRGRPAGSGAKKAAKGAASQAQNG